GRWVIWLVVRWFFFSSRRRHTRFSRDWSSDVCSSDLQQEDKHQAFVLRVFVSQKKPIVLPTKIAKQEDILIERSALCCLSESRGFLTDDLCEKSKSALAPNLSISTI